MVFKGIRSERQPIETASLNLAHRWYLGYATDEKLPDRSSLTAFAIDWTSRSSSASLSGSLVALFRELGRLSSVYGG